MLYLLKAIGFVIAFFSGLMMVSEAWALTRGCQAKWEIRTNKSGVTVKRTVRSFDARGGCSATQPNKCRERAAALAHECTDGHWSTRAQNTTPDRCRSPDISGYCIKDIKCMLEKAACQIKGGWAGNDQGNFAGRTFEVWAITGGDNKCPKSVKHYSTYGDGHPGGVMSCAGVFDKSCCTAACGASCEITPELNP